jgi:hypothetical protein
MLQVVPAYTMAPNTNQMKMLRVVVREDFTKNRCDALINDIKSSQKLLQDMDRESIKKQQDFIHTHHTASGKATHNHPKYRVRSCAAASPLLAAKKPPILTACCRGKNTRSRGKPARLTVSAKVRHQRQTSVELPGSPGSLAKTIHTETVEREQQATLRLELPGGQELLTLRFATCPS